MLPSSRVKEQLSLGHLYIIAAKAGCVCEEVRVDVDSVDLTLVYNGKYHPSDRFRRPKIDVQIKATTNWEWKQGRCAFELKKKNYEDLVERSLCPSILAVYLMPKDISQWVQHCEDSLITKHCAIWHNLCGNPPVCNKTSRTVHLRQSNILSPDSITGLLRRVARAEELGDEL